MFARAARSLFAPAMRPFTIMACAIVVLGIMDRGHGYFFSIGTIFSVMQLFATVGLVALGLGLSMLVREFDLSVAGIVGLAGCIAVLTGVENEEQLGLGQLPCEGLRRVASGLLGQAE